MGAYKDHRSGRWRFRKWIELLDGTRKRITGTGADNTKRSAEDAEAAEIDRWIRPEKAAERAKQAIEQNSASGEPTISRLIDLMCDGGTILGVKIEPYSEGSEGSNYTRAGNLRTFVEPWFGHKRASEITQLDVNAFRDAMRKLPGKDKGSKAGDQTVRNKCFALMKLLSWAVESQIILPLERPLVVKLKASQAVRATNDPIVVPVTDADCTKLISAAWDARYRLAISFGGDQGMRIGEIIGACWEDLTVKNGVTGIRIERSINARNVVGPPKGKVTRFVPLTPRTARYLAEIPRPIKGGRIILPNEQDGRSGNNPRVLGTHLTYSALNKAIKAVYRRAGIKFGKTKDGTINVWHSLRHTFGTRLVAENVQPDHIQILMGHKDYRTTQRYIKITAEQLGLTMARVFGGKVDAAALAATNAAIAKLVA